MGAKPGKTRKGAATGSAPSQASVTEAKAKAPAKAKFAVKVRVKDTGLTRMVDGEIVDIPLHAVFGFDSEADIPKFMEFKIDVLPEGDDSEVTHSLDGEEGMLPGMLTKEELELRNRRRVWNIAFESVALKDRTEDNQVPLAAINAKLEPQIPPFTDAEHESFYSERG